MLGMLAMAFFLFSSAIIGNNTTGLEIEGAVLLAKTFWWANLLPTAFWFHLTMLISQQVPSQVRVQPRKKPLFNWLSGLVYITAITLSLVGTFSDAFLDYTHSFYLTGNHVYTDVSSGYILVILFLLVTNGASFFNLLKAWRLSRSQTVTPATGL